MWDKQWLRPTLAKPTLAIFIGPTLANPTLGRPDVGQTILTDFGQPYLTDFGHPYLTDFGQTNCGPNWCFSLVAFFQKKRKEQQDLSGSPPSGSHLRVFVLPCFIFHAAPKGGGAQNFALFFRLPPQCSFFLLSLWGPSVEFWWCLKRRGLQMCTFGVLGLLCVGLAKVEKEEGTNFAAGEGKKTAKFWAVRRRGAPAWRANFF